VHLDELFRDALELLDEVPEAFYNRERAHAAGRLIADGMSHKEIADITEIPLGARN